jgi:predicted transcriptional regulator
MRVDGRVITAKLSMDLAQRLDEVSERIDRTKSWVVQEALRQWLAEEQRRHDLTIEALNDVDEGRLISHENVKERVEQKKRERRFKAHNAKLK